MPGLDRILLVEDDPDIQDVAKLSLEAIGGFGVRACLSGQEALSVGPEYRPDLILLDVMMPGMSGPETFSEMRKLDALSTTPVIFLTARAQACDVDRYKALGAISVISKPFDPMTLSATIQTIWADHYG